jgi:hypothetical protein
MRYKPAAYFGVQVNEWHCSTHEGGEKCVHHFSAGRYLLGDVSIDKGTNKN